MTFEKPYIIAEIGSNWCQYDSEKENLNCALAQIEAAGKAGASAVKFQFFRAAELWGPNCYNQNFAAEADRHALPENWLDPLYWACDGNDIDFLCSAFAVKGLGKVDQFVKMHKLASPEFTHLGMREWLKNQDKPVIYSLGCSTSDKEYNKAFKKKDVILCCVSDYPADPTHYDLITTSMIANFSDCKWGISDHTDVTWLARYARSIGATVFEKHVDFIYHRSTPDTCVSCDESDFEKYVQEINNQEIIDHEELKKKPIKKYARIPKGGDFFRPPPKG